jgi:hypothetical protein
MSRHCDQAHGLYTVYLREKDKEPEAPYCLDWRQKLLFPKPVKVNDAAADESEPEQIMPV